MGLPAAASAATPNVSLFVLTPTGPTTAEADATINPGGEVTTYAVEYGPADSTWCTSNGTSDAPANKVDGTSGIPGDSADHDVSIDLTGLTAQTAYCAEFVATNGSGSGDEGPLSWTQGEASALTFDTYSTTEKETTVDGAVDAAAQSGATYEVQWDKADSPWCTSNGTSGTPANTTAPPADFNFSDGAYHDVSADIGGLTLGTDYCAQLFATNGYGGSGGGLLEWTQGTPSVITNSADATSTTTATVTGDVDPIGQPTTYWVEYDLANSDWCTSGGGSGSPTYTTAPAGLGATDDSSYGVSVALSGLGGNLDYCAEVVAKNSYGTGESYQQFWSQPGPPPQVTVTVNITGPGTVTSTPAGIDCGGGALACSAPFAQGSQVTLTATPAASLIAWQTLGCPSPPPGPTYPGSLPNTCTLTVDSDTTVTPLFAPSPSPPSSLVSVSTAGGQTSPIGTITSSPAGIDCGVGATACSSRFPIGMQVTLTATPDAALGATFFGWSGGGCSGSGTCTFTVQADTSMLVTGTFGQGPPASCTLKPVPKVALTGSSMGILSASVTCDQDVSYAISGGVTVQWKVWVKKRHHKKRVRKTVTYRGAIHEVDGQAVAGTPITVTMKVPPAALTRLRQHPSAFANLTFELDGTNDNGAGGGTASVKHVR